MCHIFLAERGNFSRLSEALLHWDVVCRYSPWKTYPADKFSNKFGHLTKQNLFVAQRLGHDCLGLHRCVRGQRVHGCCTAWRCSFAGLGKSVQPIAIKTSKEISECYVPKKTRQTKATFCGTKILGTQLLRTTQMCQGSTCHVVAQHGDISKLNKALLLTWEVCATIAIKTSKDIAQCHVPQKARQTKANRQRQHLAQRFLGHSCLGLHRCVRVSTCHVVAQHGDISKLNKALLLTWEVCATIAIKTSKEISHRHVPKKTRQTKANKQRQHLWNKDSWGRTVWVPICAHVRAPRYMSKRTAAREPRLRSGVRVNVPVF